ncbi:MAG: hypothetical protein JSU87_03030 [Gemmatimonadota bacterium]|nr:MAG: hypothetical protein JSU87_03030 [Gemmatimonadota bacterium]
MSGPPPRWQRATMYRTCIYCNRKLGGNEVVERFPVGRQLAFDSEKGRLWVVCGRCRRWNLSPLDERWEAIEECERQFRDTRLRYSTENIGLARLREGLELVRIGRPLRPEFAAWRYGRQLVRRRVRRILRAVGQTVWCTVTAVTGAVVIAFYLTDENSRVVASVRDEHGNRLPIVRKDLKELVLEPGAGSEGWSLTVPYRPREKFGVILKPRAHGERRRAQLEGSTAIRAAGHILPRLNSFGAKMSEVKDAVALIEEVGEPERLFAVAPRIAGQNRLTLMNQETRLALEMVAHEESEQRAMEGELTALEVAWREAEEIAAIADRLLIPSSVEDWIARHKKKRPVDRAPYPS